MPTIDVSFVLSLPEAATTFDVVRRVETVTSHGRSGLVPTTFAGVIGVVTIESPDDLIRRDDGQMAPRVISVITSFQLVSVGPGRQPDQVIWLGMTYTVKQVDAYPEFGAGHYEAVCESMNAVDAVI